MGYTDHGDIFAPAAKMQGEDTPWGPSKDSACILRRKRNRESMVHTFGSAGQTGAALFLSRIAARLSIISAPTARRRLGAGRAAWSAGCSARRKAGTSRGYRWR